MGCAFHHFLISLKLMDFQKVLMTFKRRQLSLCSWGREGFRGGQEAAQLRNKSRGLCLYRWEAPETRLYHASAARPSVHHSASLRLGFLIYKMEPMISALAHSQGSCKDGFNFIQTNIAVARAMCQALSWTLSLQTRGDNV